MTSIIGAGTGNAEQRRQHERYKEIRARLMKGVVLIPAPEPEPATLPEQADVPELPMGVPLNMLAPPSWRFLLSLTALRTNISSDAILSTCRTVDLVAARSEAMALVYLHTQASLPVVGRYFKRDHTTVLHALRKRGVARAKLVDRLPPPPASPIGQAIVRNGVPIHQISNAVRKARSAKAHEAIRLGMAEGRRPEQIAQQIGYTRKSVVDIARQLGAPDPSLGSVHP